jgi:hypothetical protein
VFAENLLIFLRLKSSLLFITFAPLRSQKNIHYVGETQRRKRILYDMWF